MTYPERYSYRESVHSRTYQPDMRTELYTERSGMTTPNSIMNTYTPTLLPDPDPPSTA